MALKGSPYQNIRSLVHICRKLAANLRHVCGLSLRQVCCKHVFRMQISFLTHCSGPQCARQVCGAQLSHTVLAHNVRRKFAAHSCRALYWHSMCAATLQRTVAAHCTAHNVRRKFAAHSCRALYWHTMCAASLQRTVAAHCTGTQCAPQLCSAQLPHTILVCLKFAAHSCRAQPCSAPIPPIPPNPWFITPIAIFF